MLIARRGDARKRLGLASATAPVTVPRMRIRPLAALALILVTACLFRSYADIMRIHLDVLGALADKAAYNARSGQRPEANEVTELVYPLQRAREFAYEYRSYAERESYRRFIDALDRYQAFVGEIDAARGDAARWAAQQSEIVAQYDAWRAAAEQARAALARE